QNYQRFYSDLDVRGVYHVFNKGAGPFLAITLVDRSPSQEDRMTSRGSRTVNGRFLDAKLRYREWLGGLGVHCGETAWETKRDLRMLLGVEANSGSEARRWNGEVQTLRRDVTGARGWESAADVFSALNVGVDYVVIGNPASSGAGMGGPHPIQLLTDQYHALHTVLNARPLLGSPPPSGGSFAVSIAGGTVVVGLRIVGDGFLDPRWAAECLAARQLGADGVYRVSATDAFATCCYHAVVHAPCLCADDKAQLAKMAQSLGLAGWSLAELADPVRVKERLDELLRERGVSYTKPRDPTVFVNFAALGSRWPRVRRVFAAARRWCYAVLRGAVGFAKAGYLRTRDRFLRRAPVLRRLKNALVGRKP
ncbi:MAG TPA: hypothetical protein VFT55_07060, partial [Planctomycetota bacterium]|nr:hypothetical protein [Planctomycetota bacterium]